MATKFSGAILVATFARPIQLDKCLKSIFCQIENKPHPVVVLHQTGSSDVSKVLARYSDKIARKFELEPLGGSALENINLNRILGYEFCFKFLQCDWVLAIEEDVEVSSDALRFVEEMYERYHKRALFRGINLGSMEPFSEEMSNSYSLLRYGLHGQAAAISRRTWERFNVDYLVRSSKVAALDGQMELLLKSGFMVTPNNSRFVDTGWNGTHAPKDSNDPYYVRLRKSWVGSRVPSTVTYVRSEVEHSWRSDCRSFKLISVSSVVVVLSRIRVQFMKTLRRKIS